MQAATIRGGERVLDLGSGPGDISVMLARSGANVTGVDFARKMVDVARHRHPDIVFHEANGEWVTRTYATAYSQSGTISY